MSLNLILVVILAAIVSIGSAGVVGYNKGVEHAENEATIAMNSHLLDDKKAEEAAKDEATRYKDALTIAQNAVAATYEKGKKDAEDAAKHTVAGLRAGNLVLRDRWASCQAVTNVPSVTASSSEPDARTADREESAGRIIQAAAQCDAQVKGLQNLLTLERQKNVQQSQPEVGAHVGPLPD